MCWCSSTLHHGFQYQYIHIHRISITCSLASQTVLCLTEGHTRQCRLPVGAAAHSSTPSRWSRCSTGCSAVLARGRHTSCTRRQTCHRTGHQHMAEHKMSTTIHCPFLMQAFIASTCYTPSRPPPRCPRSERPAQQSRGASPTLSSSVTFSRCRFPILRSMRTRRSLATHETTYQLSRAPHCHWPAAGDMPACARQLRLWWCASAFPSSLCRCMSRARAPNVARHLASVHCTASLLLRCSTDCNARFVPIPCSSCAAQRLLWVPHPALGHACLRLLPP